MTRTATAAIAALLLSSAPLFAGGHMTAEAVLNHHLESFGAGDIPAILADYTEDSVLVTPKGPLQGLDSLGGFFETLVAEFSKPGMSLTMDATHFAGDVAYIVWHGETADNVYEMATDTFVIADGKIAVQTLAAKVTPK